MSERRQGQPITEVVATIGRELGREYTTRLILFHQAVAERLGLGPTDHKCLDLAMTCSAEALTAGRLAELTGLTTGAITGVIDRLEKAGFVRREKDPGDRRQVVVQVVPERMREIATLFEPHAKAWASLCARYSDEELTLVQRFMRDSIGLLGEETARVRSLEETEHPAARASGANVHAEAGENDFTVPLGKVTEGHLELARGASDLVLGVAENLETLLRLVPNGRTRRVQARRGHVELELTGKLLDFCRAPAIVDLARAVRWDITIHHGAARLEADLRGITVRKIEVHGGLARGTFHLGVPSGTTRLEIHRGASRLTVTRPSGVPVRVEVHQGAAGVSIDTLKLGSVGTRLEFESPDFAKAKNRLDIEVHGGASELIVGS